MVDFGKKKILLQQISRCSQLSIRILNPLILWSWRIKPNGKSRLNSVENFEISLNFVKIYIILTILCEIFIEPANVW